MFINIAVASDNIYITSVTLKNSKVSKCEFWCEIINALRRLGLLGYCVPQTMIIASSSFT